VRPRPAAAAGVVKAIVFSQFWMHVQLIASELSARGVPHIVLKRDMAARDKQAAVMEFRARQHSCCLVMDASGGLCRHLGVGCD
jgi:SNF2 family DNA or RNA helicase